MSNPHTTILRRGGRVARRRPNRWLIVWLVLICLACALVVAGRIVWVTRPAVRQPENKRAVSAVSNRPASAKPTASPGETATPRGEQVVLVEDDGKTLWVSPTDGPPLDLSYLPPGVQIIVALRVGPYAAHPEAGKVLELLGPLGQRGIQSVSEIARSPAGIERVVIGFRPTSDGTWEAALVYQLGGQHSAAEHLAVNLRNAVEKRHGGRKYQVAGEYAYYLPGGAEGKLMVVAREEAIADILDLAGEPPPLRRDIERLLAHTDAERQVTVVVAPNALFGGGRRMFDGAMEPLRSPLSWFLGDELSAAALSVHWADDFFMELIATPTLDTSPERTARILAERLEEVPDRLEQYVAGLDLQPFGRAVVVRFPAMFRQLVAYARRKFTADHAVLRCYLPVVAGHNLLAAAELTMAEGAGGAGSVAEATTPLARRSEETDSVRERLGRVASLRFRRDTLETALEHLAQDIGLPVVIRGADLQAEGITRNQSFGIDVENKPAEEILVEILRLANPDKAATGPDDARQKLVYVVADGGPDGADQIVVTTRAAAAARGEELPAVFWQASP